MFTGLVKAVGRVERRGQRLLVTGCAPFVPLQLGDSVAVDGVCLTVADCVGDGFLADVSEETLMRTTLGAKASRRGAVNLEPALRLADRLGGHLVSGHVDGAGTVIAVEALPQSWRLELRWNDASYGRYLCEKGSIAVDGISLTVAGCSDDGAQFWIAVIPHTWASTALQHLVAGARVNLEADLIARYAERLLLQVPGAASRTEMHDDRTMTGDWLKAHGWG
ncbi:MAG: riboflavin synthase [Synechococcus sp.]